MELKKMYPAAANSKATITMGVLDPTTTELTVLDGSVLPDAPNLLVLGTDDTAETVLLTEKSGNTLTIQRAVQGIAKPWPTGTEIARNFTAKDFDDIRENIEGINKEIERTADMIGDLKIYTDLSELSATSSTALTTIFDTMAIPSRLVCDIIGGSTDIYPADNGVLTINKTSEDTGSAVFAYGDGRVATAQFTVNSSGGGVLLNNWNRLTDRVESICNPNLLINTDFANPINQRGQTEYTSVGYTIDMWMVDHNNGKAKVGLFNDYIRLKQEEVGTKYQALLQIMENPKRFSNKTVTFSIKHKNPKESQAFFWAGSGPEITSIVTLPKSDNFIITKKTFTFPEMEKETDSVIFYVYADTSGTLSYIDIQAVKLELGTVSTLANEVVDYAEELRKCERYLQKFGSDIISATVLSTNTIFFTLPLRTEMRTKPSIVNDNLVIRGKNAVNYEGFNITVNNIRPNGIIISAEKNGHGLTDAVITSMGTVLFSAEL